MKKLAIILVAVIVIVAAAAFGADRLAQRSATSQIDAFVARPDVAGSYGRVTYSLWRRTIEIDDLVLQPAPDQPIHVGRLMIDGVGPFGSALFQPDGSIMVDLRAHLLTTTDAAHAATTTIGDLDVRGFHGVLALLSHRPVTKEDWQAWLGGITIDRLDITDLAVAVAETGTKMTVGHLLIEQMKPGAVDRLSLDKVALDLPRGAARLGRSEIQGLAYAFGDGPGAPPRVFVAQGRVAEIATGRDGHEATAKEFQLTTGGTLEKPEEWTVTVKSVDIPATAVPALTSVGYERVTLDLTSKSTYDAQQGVIDSQSEITAPDVGNLGVSIRIGNYQADAASQDTAALLKRLGEAQLDRFELHYVDASLIDRVLRFYAQSSGTDLAAIRQRLIAPLTAQRSTVADKPVAADFDAVIAFLQKPGALTIVAAPPQPVAFADLKGSDVAPQAIATRLGLTIR